MLKQELSAQQDFLWEIMLLIRSDDYRFMFMPHIDYCTKKETTLRVCHFTILYGHFSAKYINIVHKTGVQTNILGCLTCLNINWIKSYDLKHIFFHFFGFSILEEKKWKFTPDKKPFFDHFWSFFSQLHRYLSQNWVLDGHFEMLSVSKS